MIEYLCWLTEKWNQKQWKHICTSKKNSFAYILILHCIIPLNIETSINFWLWIFYLINFKFPTTKKKNKKNSVSNFSLAWLGFYLTFNLEDYKNNTNYPNWIFASNIYNDLLQVNSLLSINFLDVLFVVESAASWTFSNFSSFFSQFR